MKSSNPMIMNSISPIPLLYILMNYFTPEGSGRPTATRVGRYHTIWTQRRFVFNVLGHCQTDSKKKRSVFGIGPLIHCYLHCDCRQLEVPPASGACTLGNELNDG